MKRSMLKMFAVAVCASILSGCYGAQLVKGPINAEHASIQSDSTRVDQRRILLELTRLSRQLEEERLARTRYQARTSTTITELEETIRILINRLDDNRQRQSYGRVPPTTRPGNSAASNSDVAAADTATTPANTSGGSEDELYRAAYLDLTRGNYDLAVKGFQNYLVRYPVGGKSPDVHYYLGECYYSSDRFLEAVGAFQYVVDKFPDSRLVPAAYLKSGRCYWELEEKRLAERQYRTLIDRHPNTEEAQQARTALDEIEG